MDLSNTQEPQGSWLQNSRAVFLILVAVSLCGALLFFPALNWVVFSGDDSHIIRVALQHAWSDPYLNPEHYRELSVANYTPLPLSIYKFFLAVFGLRPLILLLFMLLTFAAVLLLSSALIYRITDNPLWAVCGIALILSLQPIHTLLSRFYTMHYLLGLVFALGALYLTLAPGRRHRTTILLALLTFLAMLSKEVFIMLPVVLVLMAMRSRDILLGALGIAAFTIYWTWRALMLPEAFEVGSEASYFQGFWNISPTQWTQFLGWYARTHAILIAACVAAAVMATRRFFMLLPMALLFGIPGLAVTHGIVDYQMHADRIFLAMDVAIAIVTAISLAGAQTSRRVGTGLVAGVFALGLIQHGMTIPRFKTESVESPDYRVTRYLLDNRQSLVGITALVPMNFIQGDLVRINGFLGDQSFNLTQNCLEALAVPANNLIAFDNSGQPLTREVIEANCRPSDQPVREIAAPQYERGYISWKLEAPPGFSGGVLFVDRVFAVPLPEFSQQLVKPASGERYQLFATDGQHWWFSEIREIEQRS